MYLNIPQHYVTQLNLKILETKEATLSDGFSKFAPYTGTKKVNFDNRTCFVGAIILGNEVLLEAIPMEDMALIDYTKIIKTKCKS